MTGGVDMQAFTGTIYSFILLKTGNSCIFTPKTLELQDREGSCKK